jgi:hypothetical protein
MDRLQLFQIDSIPRSSGKPLKADNTRERGNADHLTLPLRRIRSFGNRVEVERRRAPANDVDESAPAIYSQPWKSR